MKEKPIHDVAYGGGKTECGIKMSIRDNIQTIKIGQDPTCKRCQKVLDKKARRAE